MISCIAFVTLWHKKGDPTNISNFTFAVSAKDEKRVKKLVDKEVESYQYWKHETLISEDLVTDKESIRRIKTARLTDKVRSEAIAETIDLNKKKHAALRAKLVKSHSKCSFTSFKELLDHPFNLFTRLAQELSPVSKILIENGILYIYDPGRMEKYWETILRKEKEKLISEMRKTLDRAQKELKHIID